MKKLLIALVLFIALFLIAKNVYLSACDTPIKYKIGSVDKRFNLTNEQFLKDVNQGAQIWNKAVNKNVFLYDSKGGLIINAVFDERQALNNQINNLENQLNTGERSLDAQIASYKSELADFNKQLAALNAEIESWNAKGGAPPDVYKDLITQQNNLKAEADKLNQLGAALNQKTQAYNSQIVTLNGKIDTFNADLTLKPEEGLYNSDLNTIDIFFDISQNELVHTLAHELGHARGLEHTDGEKDIMYPQSSETITPARNDINAINTVCKKKSFLEVILLTITTR